MRVLLSHDALRIVASYTSVNIIISSWKQASQVMRSSLSGIIDQADYRNNVWSESPEVVHGTTDDGQEQPRLVGTNLLAFSSSAADQVSLRLNFYKKQTIQIWSTSATYFLIMDSYRWNYQTSNSILVNLLANVC